jgi:exopolysaccharide production protein ExoQ
VIVIVTQKCLQEINTPALIATIVYAFGIFGLFWLDRDYDAQTSNGLWIPVVWVWILGSREVSKWLALFGMGQEEMLSASPDIAGNPIDRNLYSVLLILGVIVLLRRGPRVGRLLRANGLILLFFFYCAASVLWSDYPEVSFKRFIKAITDLVMVTIVLTDPDRLAAIKRLFARAGFLLIPLSVLFIKYYPDMGMAYKHDWTEHVGVGLTTDKNALGVTCLIFGLGSLWRFLAVYSDRHSTHRIRHLLAHVILLAMVIWLLLRADSMTAFACFVLAGGVLVATSQFQWGRKRTTAHTLVAMTLTLAFFALFLDPGGGFVKTLGKDPSLSGRTGIWKECLNAAGDSLIGTGFESFWLGPRLDNFVSQHWRPNEAHNGYLEVYLNLGFLGVVLLALIIVSGYKNIIWTLGWDPEVGSLRLAYFVVELIYSFTEAGFRMMNLVWIFFMLATIAIPKRPVPTNFGARASLEKPAGSHESNAWILQA